MVAPEPAAVTRTYLEAGAIEDMETVAALVDPDCHDHKPTMNVAPTHILGARITIDELTTTEVERTEGKAIVRWGLKGHIEGGAKELKIGKLKVSTDLSVEDVDTSGELPLRRIDGVWTVTCR